MGAFADRRVAGFSQGQRIKVALARAQMHFWNEFYDVLLETHGDRNGDGQLDVGLLALPIDDTTLHEMGGFDHGKMPEPAFPLLLKFVETIETESAKR